MVPNWLRSGFAVHSLLILVLLVVLTAVAAATILTQAVGLQVEQTTDRRLSDGASYFRAALDETQEELASIGAWLVHDLKLAEAVQRHRSDDIRETVAFAIRLHTVDEVLVADGEGNVISSRRPDQLPESERNIAGSAGFLQALAGHSSYGIAQEGQTTLRQEIYVPILSPDSLQPIGILRLAKFLNDQYLALFRSRTGLEASLFFGEARLVTTIQGPNGAPLTDVGAEPSVFRDVVGEGRQVFNWRDLPGGRIRSFTSPLVGPDGTRVGMFSVALPEVAIAGETRQALPPIMLTTPMVIGIGAILTYLAAERARRPVLALAQAIARYRQGEPATLVSPVKEAELIPLAQQLELALSEFQAQWQHLNNEQARQRALFAALHDPILVTSPDGRITSFNAPAQGLFGQDQHLVERRLATVLPFVTADKKGVEEPGTWYGDIVDRSGQTLHLEVLQTSLETTEGSSNDVWVIHDISQHVELHQQQEQLLYNVAHELRNSLAVLENSLDMLARDYSELSTQDFGRLLLGAHRTSSRLRDLMENLLSAGAIQSGRLQIRLIVTDFSYLLSDVLETLGPTLALKRQQVKCEAHPLPLLVMADGRYLRQVLVNLLTNGSKYGPDKDVIIVKTEQDRGFVRITVEDHGPGISPEARQGLFERFYRGRSTNEAPGIGLGLAIAKGIVQAHGGDMGIESEPGNGTRVWFTVPLAERSSQ